MLLANSYIDTDKYIQNATTRTQLLYVLFSAVPRYGTASTGHLSCFKIECFGLAHRPNTSRLYSLADLQPISLEVSRGNGLVVS